MYRPSTSSKPADRARLAFVDIPSRIEVLHARFECHEFVTHAHDTWSIAAVVSGAQDIAPRGAPSHVATAGQIYALPPDAPHAGRPLAEHCEYVMLYVPNDEWRAQCSANGVDPACLPNTALKDTSTATLLADFVNRIMRRSVEVSAWSGEWVTLCESLLRPYRDACVDVRRPRPMHGDPGLARAVDYLRTHWNRNVLLDEVANEASVSTFELCRRFMAAFGLTPHRYQLVLRVTNAKIRLLRGARISDVACEVGFADQSHLGRHFKAILGVTPGAVAKEAIFLSRFDEQRGLPQSISRTSALDFRSI
jgi:AraC-like DNA-binding protein